MLVDVLIGNIQSNAELSIFKGKQLVVEATENFDIGICIGLHRSFLKELGGAQFPKLRIVAQLSPHFKIKELLHHF